MTSSALVAGHGMRDRGAILMSRKPVTNNIIESTSSGLLEVSGVVLSVAAGACNAVRPLTESSWDSAMPQSNSRNPMVLKWQ